MKKLGLTIASSVLSLGVLAACGADNGTQGNNLNDPTNVRYNQDVRNNDLNGEGIFNPNNRDMLDTDLDNPRPLDNNRADDDLFDIGDNNNRGNNNNDDELFNMGDNDDELFDIGDNNRDNDNGFLDIDNDDANRLERDRNQMFNGR